MIPPLYAACGFPASGIGGGPDARRKAVQEAPAMAVERAASPTRTRDKLRVVIAGGGVAALETALALRFLAEERAAIQLTAPEPHFWYRPLSVLEPFGGRVHPLELADVARACGADFDLGALASVDADGRVARTAAGTAYEYDALVIACGARPLEAL